MNSPSDAPRIGLVTDSNSQITPDLVARFGVEVVPLTVTIDGTDHREGVDLDADGFYARFADRTPDIATSQPSPGQFVAAYARLAAAGCAEIVSVHLSATMSGTVGAATLAADSAPVPVHVVDTASASFGVAVCVWAAGAARDAGGDVAAARAAIDAIVPRLGTAFMVGVPLLIERGGRAAGADLDGGDGVPVLAMRAGVLAVLERVSTIEDTVDVLSTYAAGWGSGTTVAVGVSDPSSRSLAHRLTRALDAADGVDRVLGYRIGPSVGAHTGPGTFGLFVFPTID